MNRVGRGAVRKLEGVISYVLIIGVVTSLLFEDRRYYPLLSRIRQSRYFSRQPDVSPGRELLCVSRPPVFRVIHELAHQSDHSGHCGAHPDPLRKSHSFRHLFCSPENWKYLVITLFVLTILTISLLIH